MLRRLGLILPLGVLTISLLLSLGPVHRVSANSSCKPTYFSFSVYMYPSHGGQPGYTESNLEWLQEWNLYAISWCPDSPYYYEGRGPFPPEEYKIGRIYVCHGDWIAYSEVYDDTFRYRWWIFWKSEEAAAQPGAKSLGGYFIFSDGTGDFENMWAYGKAWVEMLPGQYYPIGCQYHEGFIFGGP